MERKYYGINEAGARQAKQMMSFFDYEKDSKTKEYKIMVDRVYEVAEMVEEKRPKEAERAQKLADQYSRLLANYFNDDIRIGLMCPSVMISGAGNFQVKKKEKQNRAWEKNHEQYMYIQTIPQKIENILYMKEIIKSGDEDAIEKLQEKLEKLQSKQDYMKKANAHFRKNKTMAGFDGITEEKAKKLDVAISESWHNKPYASYMLTNNNATINSTKKRLESLINAKSQDNKVEENEHFKVVENTEIMRLQLFFDEKPSDEIRTALKSNGFRFSPKNNNAWQRQLTNNARYALKRVLEVIGNE